MVIAEVAQLVEQRIRNAWVTGSSPVFGSTFLQRDFFAEGGKARESLATIF